MKNKYRGSFVKANFWTCKNLCQSEITLTETILNEDIKIIAAQILPCEIAHCGIWKELLSSGCHPCQWVINMRTVLNKGVGGIA